MSTYLRHLFQEKQLNRLLKHILLRLLLKPFEITET